MYVFACVEWDIFKTYKKRFFSPSGFHAMKATGIRIIFYIYKNDCYEIEKKNRLMRTKKYVFAAAAREVRLNKTRRHIFEVRVYNTTTTVHRRRRIQSQKRFLTRRSYKVLHAKRCLKGWKVCFLFYRL